MPRTTSVFNLQLHWVFEEKEDRKGGGGGEEGARAMESVQMETF